LQQLQLDFVHSDVILWSQVLQVHALSTNSVALVVSFISFSLHNLKQKEI
jgi:hypothetical protein